MLQSLAEKVGRDKGLPERAARLDVLNRVLNGTIYNVLRHPFYDERTSSGEYIPLRERRPCVRYNLCKLIVDDLSALLFGEGRFPAIMADDEETVAGLTDLIVECKIPQVMHQAAWSGSIGSSAILFRVLKERPFFDVMPTRFLTPEWDPEAPDTLKSVTERYKVQGADLMARGYRVDQSDLSVSFWFQRVWDGASESWFLPIKDGQDADLDFKLDKARTVQHELGFVPIVWMKNLPGGDDIDGACSFQGGIETQIEIEYQLSQAGRGLKYSADPLLMIREPAASPGEPIMRSASNALIVASGTSSSQGGDAKMLEINGTAATAVIEYVRALREMALEVCHGNRSNADKVSAAQSGKVLELLNQPLLQQADALRNSYGDNGLIPLLRMVCAASARVGLRLHANVLKNLKSDGLGLRWQPWFDATEGDLQAQATTLSALKNAGLMSRDTAVRVMAPAYDIDDVDAEIANIKADEAVTDARLAQQAAQVKATEPVET